MAEAGTIQFQSATFTASEFGTFAPVVVTRTGGSQGVVSVFVSTEAGDAVPGEDYRQVSRYVVFGDGDVEPKHVIVPILGDALEEDDETPDAHFE